MSKYVLIPDSFKGTMSSPEICEIMKKAILKNEPFAKVAEVPVADGGEGSVDSFLQAVGGEKKEVVVSDPYFNKIKSFYGILNNSTAVIEMAAAAGLPLVGDKLRAEKTTTFGVGELIIDALNNNCKNIILGLGGSATNDGGCGAAAAVGVKFYNEKNETFIPVGETLCDIVKIDLSEMDKRILSANIVTMCDIDNPLCGINGAAYVFGPQKGADKEMVKVLDKNLHHLAEVISKDLNKDVEYIAGAGAAGGMGAGTVAFFGSNLQMGIETVLDTVGFNDIIQDADYIFTGEGKIDSQSLRGKVVIGVAKRAKSQNVPVIAIVGDIGDNIDSAYEEGVNAIFSINRVAVPYKEAKLRAKDDLYLTIDNIIRFKNMLNKNADIVL